MADPLLASPGGDAKSGSGVGIGFDIGGEWKMEMG